MKHVRINIPVNVQEAIELANLIKAKHDADAEASPLKALKETPWEGLSNEISACLEEHLKAEELRRQMELAYRERDRLFKPISENIKASRDLLLGVYRTNPKKLGEWGYVVSDSPARQAARFRRLNDTAPAV